MQSGLNEHCRVTNTPNQQPKPSAPPDAAPRPAEQYKPKEIGGPAGLEPTRYGDWEKKGRCIDF